MNDTFEFTLNSPLTEEQWDMITDVDMERTDSVTFHTKHGKEVEFAKVRHGKWKWLSCTYDRVPKEKEYECSECHHKTIVHGDDMPWEKYCPNCGAKMDGTERKEE